ncbi:MAG: S1/P1 nuclease [Bacteroidota bacterium]
MKLSFPTALFALLVCLGISLHGMAWGPTGHRTIGEIASHHLSKKARKGIEALIGKESVAVTSTWMDEVRSDTSFRYAGPWHYVTIPDGQTYASAEKSDRGDVIEAIERLTAVLKDQSQPAEKRLFAYRALVHFVGDIHQPLHVGNGTDRGGNQVDVQWFGKSSNLHRVWDSGMIDSKKFSYTELARNLDVADKAQVKQWQASSVRDWARESMTYRDQVYAIGEGNLGYRYLFLNWDTVELRLHQAGIRLAGLLNEAFQ